MTFMPDNPTADRAAVIPLRADPRLALSSAAMRAADAMFARSTLLCDADFILSVPYVVKGWFHAEQVSIVFGPSNTGKTAWVLDIARALASDEDWADCRVRKGTGVLYIAAEAPSSIFRRTASFPDIAKGRIAVYPEPVDLVADALSGEKIAGLARVHKERDGLEISLIVIDTLTLCFGEGDENSTNDARRAIASAKVAAERSGAHVMLIHHTGKDAKAGARGAYSITANSDTVIELEPVGDADGYVVAHQRKQREIDKDQTAAFQVVSVELGHDEDGDPITTAGIEILGVGTLADTATPPRRDDGMAAVLVALAELEAEAGQECAGFTS